MEIVNLVFWIALGLLYLDVHFPYQELAIGICALIIGIAQLMALIPKDGGATSPPKG